MAFPCDQFGGEEFATAKAINNFVKKRGVEFSMMAKCDVNGPNESAVWKYLKSKFPGEVQWNFAATFIVDRKGCVVLRSSDSPEELEPIIKKYLYE